jgi:probable HAF family extracellular repeat protein
MLKSDARKQDDSTALPGGLNHLWLTQHLPLIYAITLFDTITSTKSIQSSFRFITMQFSYTVTDLGTLGGTNSVPYAINNKGQVVGSSKITSGNQHAFLWKRGTLYDLNSLISNNSGWELTNASSINDVGQIVGTGKFNGQQRTFLLTPLRVIH